MLVQIQGATRPDYEYPKLGKDELILVIKYEELIEEGTKPIVGEDMPYWMHRDINI